MNYPILAQVFLKMTSQKLMMPASNLKEDV